MKNLIQLSLLLSAFLWICTSCEEQDLPECVKGRVIGYEYCTNAVLIKLSSEYEFGGLINKYYNDSSYINVVRAPGELGEYGQNDLYFTYRNYDKERDYSLFEYQETPCNQYNYPFDVPTIVIINYSTSNCPSSHEN